MRREQLDVGVLIRSGSSNGSVTVLESDELGLVSECRCASGSIPSAVAGYAVGCLLIDTTTGEVYWNIGSVTSCTFSYISPSASVSPSRSPSISPSISPSASISPSISPSRSPSVSPSISPSVSPSISPSVSPS